MEPTLNSPQTQELLPSHFCLGDGAVFWVHISPDKGTPDLLNYWCITFEHEGGLWKDSISSDNPARILKTPALDGIFYLTVEAAGPDHQRKIIRSFYDSQPEIGCNQNCASMIGMEAVSEQEIRYWTVWNAFCHYK